MIRFTLRRDFRDPVIGKNEDSYLTLGAELRYRYEFLTTDWSTDPQDNDGYHWLRALPVADWHVTKHTRLFAELIAATALDREPEPSPIDKDEADFLQLNQARQSLRSQRP